MIKFERFNVDCIWFTFDSIEDRVMTISQYIQKGYRVESSRLDKVNGKVCNHVLVTKETKVEQQV